MIAQLLQRLLVLLLRFLAVWLLVALVVEIAMTGPRVRGEAVGGQTMEIVRELATGNLPTDLVAVVSGEATGVSWLAALGKSTLASFTVCAFAILVMLSFGPVFGVLAGRYRRHPWFEAMLSPLLAAAWLPGFWIASLAVWWQVEHWGMPGFADGEAATGGPMRIEWLWRTSLVALPVALVAIGWQVRFIAGTLRRSAGATHVLAAYSRGMGGGGLFYRHVFRNSLYPLIRSIDRSLPAMLGMQLLVEWAFRYPGLGTLVIESARSSQFAGLLSGGLLISTLLVVAHWVGETTATFLPQRASAI